ncbi:unnamed protein product, partial [Didymodactylos carnosus]
MHALAVALDFSTIENIGYLYKSSLSTDKIWEIAALAIFRAIAYADDVNTIVRDLNEETETIAMFDLYNKASGAKTNTEKTELFWISEWLPPPPFRAK